MALKTMPPPRPLDEDWVSSREIGDLAVPAVDSTTVDIWRYRGKSAEVAFPEPDDRIGTTPIWRLERVLAWFELTGRPFDVDGWREKRRSGAYQRSYPKRATTPSASLVEIAKLYKRSLKVTVNGKPLFRKAPWIQQQLAKRGEHVELTAVRNRISRARAAGLIT